MRTAVSPAACPMTTKLFLGFVTDKTETSSRITRGFPLLARSDTCTVESPPPLTTTGRPSTSPTATASTQPVWPVKGSIPVPLAEPPCVLPRGGISRPSARLPGVLDGPFAVLDALAQAKDGLGLTALALRGRAREKSVAEQLVALGAVKHDGTSRRQGCRDADPSATTGRILSRSSRRASWTKR